LAVNDVLGPDGQKSEAFVTILNSGVSGLSDALSGQPGADLAKSAANLTQNTLDAFSTALADDPDLIKNCIDKFLPMVQITFVSIGGAAGAGVEGAAEGFGEGLVRASKVVWNKAAKIGEESGEGFADTAGSFFKMAREGCVQNPFRGMFSGPRERGPGGRLRVNATRDVLILVGAGATLVTIGVGTPVAGVYASYKCVQLVSEKIKRKMFYPKILEYLEPYEKDFSLSDVQGSKEFKNKLYTLVANIKAAAKNNEEINPITFFGEAGVGKTLMAKVVGAEMEKLGYRFVRFNITSLKDCHNPEDEVRRVFELTRKKKWILFIDEADQLLFLNRNSQKLNDKSRSLMMKVMEVTGGKMSGKFEGLILCSTNNLADVDEPMLQRFASKVIVFPKPDVDVVKQILQKNIQEQLFA
jgi:hypothetical protein